MDRRQILKTYVDTRAGYSERIRRPVGPNPVVPADSLQRCAKRSAVHCCIPDHIEHPWINVLGYVQSQGFVASLICRRLVQFNKARVRYSLVVVANW